MRMPKILTEKDFLKRIREVHGSAYDYSEVVFTSFNSKVIIKDRYGKLLVWPSALLRGAKPCITSAVCKTEYFKNELAEVHGGRYDYSKLIYKGALSNIIIGCEKHGYFDKITNDHKKGAGCPKCSLLDKYPGTEDFVEKAKKVHGNEYGYNKCVYLKAISKVIITCKKHGDFKQRPNDHLSGQGCPTCGRIKLKNSTNGWTYSKWEEAGLGSTNFDSFKVYVIRCWNDDEEFYKIGKTFLTLDKRFRTLITMPYNWEVIEVFEGDSKDISELEVELQNKNKVSKYTPKIRFSGVQECYKDLTNILELLQL